MHKWTSLLQRFGHSRRSSYEATVELTKAYQSVFYGNPGRDQQEMVLADLHRVSGFQRITAPPQSTEELWYNEGRRSLYAHIFGFLRFDDTQLRALEEAAIREAAAEQSHMNQ